MGAPRKDEVHCACGANVKKSNHKRHLGGALHEVEMSRLRMKERGWLRCGHLTRRFEVAGITMVEKHPVSLTPGLAYRRQKPKVNWGPWAPKRIVLLAELFIEFGWKPADPAGIKMLREAERGVFTDWAEYLVEEHRRRCDFGMHNVRWARKFRTHPKVYPYARAALVLGFFFAWARNPKRGAARWERYTAKKYEEETQREVEPFTWSVDYASKYP